MLEILIRFSPEILVSLGIWYIVYGAEYFSEGGKWEKNIWLMPFKRYWEEILWHLPGGRARRIAKIKERVGTSIDGVLVGRKHTWSYDEIRAHDLYAQCADDVLPGLAHCVLFALVPIAVAIAIVAVVGQITS